MCFEKTKSILIRWGKRSSPFDEEQDSMKRTPLRWGKREPLRWGKRAPSRYVILKHVFQKLVHCVPLQFISASKYEMHRIARIKEILTAYFAPKTIYLKKIIDAK